MKSSVPCSWWLRLTAVQQATLTTRINRRRYGLAWPRFSSIHQSLCVSQRWLIVQTAWVKLLCVHATSTHTHTHTPRQSHTISPQLRAQSFEDLWYQRRETYSCFVVCVRERGRRQCCSAGKRFTCWLKSRLERKRERTRERPAFRSRRLQ